MLTSVKPYVGHLETQRPHADEITICGTGRRTLLMTWCFLKLLGDGLREGAHVLRLFLQPTYG